MIRQYLSKYRNERHFRKLKEDLSVVLQDGSITMLDVGAAGGILPRWEGIKKYVTFLGIEPDKRSYEDLLNSKDKDDFFSYNIICKGAWSTETRIKINFTRKPLCSTYFLPNKQFLSLFPESERFDIMDTFEIDCIPVDAMLDQTGAKVDLIKLDLEGGEIEILNGAERILRDCLAVHLETAFQDMRVGQPLFGDVCRRMNEFNFEFIDFVGICRWERDKHDDLGQAIFADALFLKTPEYMIGSIQDNKDISTVRSYLAILIVYERYDLALKFMDLLRKTPFFDPGYDAQTRSILIRRRENLHKVHRFMRRMNSIATLWGSPHTTNHLVY